jgi:hypothetical protein
MIVLTKLATPRRDLETGRLRLADLSLYDVASAACDNTHQLNSAPLFLRAGQSIFVQLLSTRETHAFVVPFCMLVST